jgi:hypothetical protein
MWASVTRFVLMVLLLVGSASCSNLLTTSLEDGIERIGVVDSVVLGRVTTRVLMTDVDPPVPEGSPNAIYLIVGRETEIVIQEKDGRAAPGALSDLHVGARIRALHGSVELRSLPAQYDALRIWVLRP